VPQIASSWGLTITEWGVATPRIVLLVGQFLRTATNRSGIAQSRPLSKSDIWGMRLLLDTTRKHRNRGVPALPFCRVVPGMPTAQGNGPDELMYAQNTAQTSDSSVERLVSPGVRQRIGHQTHGVARCRSFWGVIPRPSYAEQELYAGTARGAVRSTWPLARKSILPRGTDWTWIAIAQPRHRERKSAPWCGLVC
jgi:hypothetical protein